MTDENNQHKDEKDENYRSRYGQIKECPCCEREFKDLEDFPRVLVKRVEKFPVEFTIDYRSSDFYDPRKIKEKPYKSEPLLEDVLELFYFSDDNYVVHGEYVYIKDSLYKDRYQRYRNDKTFHTQRFLELPTVIDFFSSLDKLPGKEIKPDELVSNLCLDPINSIEYRMSLELVDVVSSGEDESFIAIKNVTESLKIMESISKDLRSMNDDKKYRKGKLMRMGSRFHDNFYFGCKEFESNILAKVFYEGRLNFI